MVAEMHKLRQLLNESGIAWEDCSTGPDVYLPIDRTHFEHGGFSWSVVNGYGSYGGWDYMRTKNEGFLEVMSNALNDGDPLGWLTAEEVMDLVRGNSATT